MGTWNILVVDNNPLIVRLMENFLAKLGHRVRTAENGLAAIEVLADFWPDIIFVDLVMPKIPGEKLCRIVRAMPGGEEIFLVVLSAVAVEQDVDFRSFGADACIAKGPFKEVERHIRALFDEIAKGREGAALPDDVIGTENVFERIVTKELLSTKRHFEVTLDHMAEGFIELATDLRIVYVNPVAARLLGDSEERILSTPLLDYFDDTGKRRLCEAAAATSDGPVTIGEKTPLVIGGRQVAVTLVRARDREHDSIITILQDITERKAAEQELADYRANLEVMVARRTRELEKKNEHLRREIEAGLRMAAEKRRLEQELRQRHKMEALGTMAAGISHDFNNILTAILGYTELVRMSCKGSPEAEHLENVLTAGRRAKDLIKQILSFSRQREQSLSPLLLHLPLAEVLKLIRASTPAAIRIEEDLDHQCPPVLADATQIHQVIMNICTNAVRAMEESGGVLTVSLRAARLEEGTVPGWDLPAGEYARMTFADTGVGMDEAVREKIFDPYFTTRPSGEGTGMGLAVVHGIVSSHGGAVTVESEPGRGTVFTVFLPQATASSGTGLDHEALPPAAAGGEVILLIDDEEPVLQVAGRCLANLGYRVKTASSAEQGLALFEADPDLFDLVLTDQTMPGMSGSEFIGRLHELRPGLPAILCSGYGPTLGDRELGEIGAAAFLHKPFSFPELAAVVARVLGKGQREGGSKR